MTSHPLWRPLDLGANARRQTERVAWRQTEPGPLQPHDRAWVTRFEAVRRDVLDALGARALAITHVGSTAVADLWAKPVLDVDLTVADAAREEDYVPSLVAKGFRLIFRDAVAGEAHRHLTLAEPNTNLHVWSPGAIEPQRHLLFVAWLREHPEERRRYEAAKRKAVAGPGRYNDLKAAVVHAIYERALTAADVARGTG